jgi:hypothetical protein
MANASMELGMCAQNMKGRQLLMPVSTSLTDVQMKSPFVLLLLAPLSIWWQE